MGICISCFKGNTTDSNTPTLLTSNDEYSSLPSSMNTPSSTPFSVRFHTPSSIRSNSTVGSTAFYTPTYSPSNDLFYLSPDGKTKST
ncbi:hypothetical protein P9112_001245 [Eukaryota sp. TZLM1-RC]